MKGNFCTACWHNNVGCISSQIESIFIHEFHCNPLKIEVTVFAPRKKPKSITVAPGSGVQPGLTFRLARGFFSAGTFITRRVQI